MGDEVEEMKFFEVLRDYMRGALGLPELEARLDGLEKEYKAALEKSVTELEERFEKVAKKVARDFTAILQRSGP